VGLFPTLAGTDPALSEWDILSLGYSTSLLPDIRSVWSADPDLPILATHLRTRLEMAPLAQYRSLALVAHSMGGLVVQRALLDDSELVPRIKHLVLFGTPSTGLTKAGFFAFLKPQLRNMAAGGEFVAALRREWTERFDDAPPFHLLVVAGDRDQFVPPESSLSAFAPRFRRVVAGDHLTMIKATDARAEGLNLLIAALSTRPEPPAAAATLRASALEMTEPQVERALADREDKPTQAEVVNAAIKFDLDGKRQHAIELLERHLGLGEKSGAPSAVDTSACGWRAATRPMPGVAWNSTRLPSMRRSPRATTSRCTTTPSMSRSSRMSCTTAKRRPPGWRGSRSSIARSRRGMCGAWRPRPRLSCTSTSRRGRSSSTAR
jgi:hypothetical protein